MRGSSQSDRAGPSTRYALVRWLTGRDVGTLTHNVNVDWILNFDESDLEESQVVEWRVPPKPKSGWPLYDGQVLAISDDVEYLYGRMKEEQQSQGRKRNEREAEVEQENQGRKRNEREVEVEQENQGRKRNEREVEVEQENRGRKRNEREVEQENRGRKRNGWEELQDSGKKNTETPFSTPSRGASFEIDDVQRVLRVLMSGNTSTPSASGNSSTPNSPLENQVKVGEVLSLSNTAYMEAKLARTPTSMTMDLVRCSFSKERRRRSSYAGQKRARNGVISQKPSLKKYRKMKDIQNFVNQRFPYFSQSQFGHAVNAVLGKNVDRQPERKYVLESESEDEEME